MTPLSCGATERLLQAYHDGELPVRDQIAVSAHIEWCEACASSLSELREIGAALTSLTHTRRALSNEEAAVFNQTVVNRLKAEDDASLLSRLRYMFDDVRLVYAGAGAAASCAVCVVIMLGMMRFATVDGEKPDSLAAIVTLVSTPLECDPGVNLSDASGCHARWEARFRTANESAEQESVFALDQVVTHRSGHLADLTRLRTGRHDSAQAQMIEALLDAVSRSRLESALPSGVPITASMVWMVEHATVRASSGVKPPVLEPIVPSFKRRAATTPWAGRSTWS